MTNPRCAITYIIGAAISAAVWLTVWASIAHGAEGPPMPPHAICLPRDAVQSVLDNYHEVAVRREGNVVLYASDRTWTIVVEKAENVWCAVAVGTLNPGDPV